jgi:hypothetical protein
MLTTTLRNHFDILAGSSSVTFFPATARIGNALVPFDGTVAAFRGMTGLSTGTPGYQNVLMYLEMSDTTSVKPDMTGSVSSIVSTPAGLTYPSMPVSTTFPVGLFTFQSDGTTVQLISIKGV